MRPRSLLLLPLVVSWAAAWGQSSAPLTPRPAEAAQEQALDGRQNQRIQRIRVEDSGVRIDELRVGGQTQSIVVQPKGDLPEYEIQPADMARTRPADNREGIGSANGQRVWNVLKF